MSDLHHHIADEIRLAASAGKTGDLRLAFSHLERAHVLGQSLTASHTRVHWLMFKLAFKMRSPREIWGQIVRIVGAATKTPLGIYPTGNTGGSNVWFFKPLPLPEDLASIIDRSRQRD
jgi:Protein of unknown function (DUF3703)